MLGLAAYDRDADLIRRLAAFLPIMDASQRMVYYSTILSPEVPEHRAFLLEGLSDKSRSVQERIVERLQYYPLFYQDMERLTELY